MNYNSGGYIILDLSWYKKHIDTLSNTTLKLTKNIIKQLSDYVRLKSTKYIHLLAYTSSKDDSNIILKTFIGTSIGEFYVENLPNDKIYELKLLGSVNVSEIITLYINLTKGEITSDLSLWNPPSPASVVTQSLDTEESKEVKS